ncbi:hypothetical protein HMPREF1586_01362 [Gardnerella vaginalis JCP8522]|nr:hypothetical protein HMPREF1586_01362 [Gardnerella vaginalis JCP8522]
MLCVLPYFDYNRCANSGKTTLYVVRLRDDLPERLKRSAKAIRSAEPLKRKVQ